MEYKLITYVDVWGMETEGNKQTYTSYEDILEEIELRLGMLSTGETLKFEIKAL